MKFNFAVSGAYFAPVLPVDPDMTDPQDRYGNDHPDHLAVDAQKKKRGHGQHSAAGGTPQKLL